MEQLQTLIGADHLVTLGHAREADIEDADIIVTCAGWLPDAEWQALGELCAQHATPWHSTYVEGDTVVVGPLFQPARTANYLDVRGRRLAAAEAPDELLGLWSYLESVQPKPPVPWTGPTAAVVAGLIAADVLAVAQGEPCPTQEHQLVFRPSIGTIERHRVLPLPAFDPAPRASGSQPQ